MFLLFIILLGCVVTIWTFFYPLLWLPLQLLNYLAHGFWLAVAIIALIFISWCFKD